ncbi:MAG: hypothetical protein V2A54_12080 [Bacteroidota bacterium]
MFQWMQKENIYSVKLLFFVAALFFQSCFSGKDLSVSLPEKCWAMRHPFVLHKAIDCTNKAKKITDSILLTNKLDGDANGGQLDAFRHACWMALLTKNIGYHRALSLGRAHEKGNYQSFLKRKNEDGSLADKAATDMDLWNNKMGAAISKQYKGKDLLILYDVIISSIQSGRMKMIKKNLRGQSLDDNGNIIPGRGNEKIWNTTRVLVPSDYIRQ